jgi:hypothetical protein
MKTDKEANEVFAKFHGWKHKPTLKGKGKGLWYFPEWGKAAFNGDCFRYHVSLDWQEQVLNKIRGMSKIISIEIMDEEIVCQIRHSVLSGLADFSGSSKTSIPEAVYKACLEFITWYNQQSK